MKNNEVVWTRFYDELERKYRRINNRLTQKVKIKSWQQMLDENSIGADGDIINTSGEMWFFTAKMEHRLPKNRIISVCNETIGFPIWSNDLCCWIEEWMIDKTWSDNK